MKKLFALSWCLALFVSTPSFAVSLGDGLGISPFYDFKQIETEHFMIYFPSELTPQAKRVAQIYEETHQFLKLELDWQPALKTNVLIVDQFDAANGLTSAVSRLGMVLYLTPPETWFSTNYYEDWLRLLIVHEYTHFLNMDATRDFYKILRYVFGDVILPNAFWPSWMLEGLAVYMETKHTKAGRGVSPLYEMILRVATANNALGKSNFVPIDRINGPWPSAPKGETPYFFGYQLMETAAQLKADSMTEMTRQGSYRLPYFVNKYIEKASSKSWYELWDIWKNKTELRMKQSIDVLKNAGLTKVELDRDLFTDVLGNAVSPNGRFQAFQKTDENHWQALYLRDLESLKTKEIEDKFLGASFAFSADSKNLFYSSLKRRGIYNFKSDIKVYDLEDNSSYWLTKNARAKDPSVSADGKWITYTIAKDSSNQLVLAQLNKNPKTNRYELSNSKIIVSVAMFDRISQPTFHPNSKEIAFSYKKNGTLGESIWTYSLERAAATQKILDTNNNRFPTYDLEGNLYFISDRSGVDNLFQVNAALAGSSIQRTNVLSGIWLPHFSTKGLYGSVYDLAGWHLAKIEISRDRSYVTESVKISKNNLETLSSPATETPQSYTKPMTVENYSVLPTLLPRQWAPIALWGKDQVYAGGQVLGYDSTFRHQYLAYGAFDSRVRQWDGYANYLNRVYALNLNVAAQSTLQDYTSASNSTSGQERFSRKTELDAALSLPIHFTISTLTPTVGYEWSKIENFESTSEGNQSLSRGRNVPAVYTQLQFKNTRTSPYGIAPERGYNIFLGHKRYFDPLYENDKAQFSYTHYLQIAPHFVLQPNVRATQVSKTNPYFSDANAIYRGRRGSVFSPFVANNFDSTPIRGYPFISLASKRVYGSSVDLQIPIYRIFRGWGTRPIFFDQIYATVFSEVNYFTASQNRQIALPSAGAGLRAGSEWLYNIPLIFAVDYHQGFRSRYGGTGEIFFSINLSTLPFTF